MTWRKRTGVAILATVAVLLIPSALGATKRTTYWDDAQYHDETKRWNDHTNTNTDETDITFEGCRTEQGETEDVDTAYLELRRHRTLWPDLGYGDEFYDCYHEDTGTWSLEDNGKYFGRLTEVAGVTNDDAEIDIPRMVIDW